MRNYVVIRLAYLLTALPAAAQPLEARLPTCFACHGESGQSQLPDVPSLGAQPALYSLIQLVMFRDELRVTEPMNTMTKGLSDQDLRKAADVISKLPAPAPAADNSDDSRMEKGRMLAEQHRCNFCHRTNFQGGENVPRLAGQREDYLLKALHDYKSGVRSGGGQAAMADVAYPLSEEEIEALAHYLAHL